MRDTPVISLGAGRPMSSSSVGAISASLPPCLLYTSLTEEGAAILADYENFCAKLREQGDELFDRCFERWLK